MTRNIFWLGLDEFNRRKLDSLRGVEELRFYQLLASEKFADAPGFHVRSLLREAEQALDHFPGSIDAIVCYMDFPAWTLVPLLCWRFGLRSATLESVLCCEHKYWSRLEQHKVIPAHVPRFIQFNPYDSRALERIDLSFPLWVKPVKSFGSHLGFKVRRAEDFNAAVKVIRERLPRLAEPFNEVLAMAELPPEVAGVDGYHCVVEELISGRQCTLEGSVFEGELFVHGVVDSIREPQRSSFTRYQYPSSVPRRVQERMRGILGCFLAHIDFDNSGFNAEFLWDEQRDLVWLLEVNPRIAQHHSDLFEKVDGVSNHQVVVDVALGRRPEFPCRQGVFKYAAVFFVREHRNGIVTRLPAPQEVELLEREIPGTLVLIKVLEGEPLFKLVEQDSYSYICAMVYLGADSPRELLRKFRICRERLSFQFAPLPDLEPVGGQR